MNEEQGRNVSSIIMSNEQFAQLLQTVQQTITVGQTSSLCTAFPSPTTSMGSFVKCTNRFDGGPDCDVNAFIDSIQTYK